MKCVFVSKIYEQKVIFYLVQQKRFSFKIARLSLRIYTENIKCDHCSSNSISSHTAVVFVLPQRRQIISSAKKCLQEAVNKLRGRISTVIQI